MYYVSCNRPVIHLLIISYLGEISAVNREPRSNCDVWHGKGLLRSPPYMNQVCGCPRSAALNFWVLFFSRRSCNGWHQFPSYAGFIFFGDSLRPVHALIQAVSATAALQVPTRSSSQTPPTCSSTSFLSISVPVAMKRTNILICSSHHRFPQIQTKDYRRTLNVFQELRIFHENIHLFSFKTLRIVSDLPFL